MAFGNCDSRVMAIPLLVFREFSLLPNHKTLSSQRKMVISVNNLIIKSGKRNDPFMEAKGYNTHQNPFEKKMRNKYVFLEIQDSQFDYAIGNPRLPALGAMFVRSQDKSIYFNKGDQVVVAIAYHYKKNEFTKFIKMYFDLVKLFVSEDGSYALALCKK